jgi:phosphoribosyl 1,2-cyclic phosphodiesterase
MRIDLLCSGSKGNSCLIRHNDFSILIDCGSTKKYLMSRLNQVQANLQDINGVLVTHAHTDHVSQLKHFNKLDVYSYCELKDALDKHDVIPGQNFQIQDFNIRVLGLSHDAPNTIGFVVECDGEKLVYVTDTGYVPNQVKPYIENADYYIFESNHDVDTLLHTNRPMFLKQRILSDSGHLNNEDSSINLANVINTNTKNIVLAHLSEEANTPDLALDTFRDVLLRKDIHLSGVDVVAAKQFEITTFGK